MFMLCILFLYNMDVAFAVCFFTSNVVCVCVCVCECVSVHVYVCGSHMLTCAFTYICIRI